MRKDVVGPGNARLRILVADDNQDCALSLALILKIMGHEAEIAHDGADVLEIGERFKPQVALLDLGMPKLNGYDACKRVRETEWGKSALLIAETGWGQEDDRRRSREAGFDHHLVKPLDPAEVRAASCRVAPRRTRCAERAPPRRIPVRATDGARAVGSACARR